MDAKLIATAGLLTLAALGSAQDQTGILSLLSQPDKRLAVNISYLGRNMTVWGGPLRATFNDQKFETYCVDLDHWNTATSAYEVKATTIDHLNHGARAAYLYNKYAGTVNNGIRGAALQMAIWDVVTDGGDGFGSGKFKLGNVNSEARNLAASFVAESAGKSGVATYFQATSHGANCDVNQNMMGAVPEPGTMAVLGLGAAAIMRRRRAAKK